MANLQFHPSSDMSMTAEEMNEIISQLLRPPPENRLTHQQIQDLTRGLPHVTESDLTTAGHHDSVCPICFNTFLSILAEEEMALAMDSPAHPVEELGVTKLHKTCGHLFCRRDITKWMRDGNESCPSCRTPFITASGPGDGAAAEPRPTRQESLRGDDFLRQFIVESTAAPVNPLMNLDHLPILAVGGDQMRRGHSPREDRRDDRSEFNGMYS
ncbi:hypothetical protein BV22DRAFT_1116461 [Leucogyrophana mollusca]|uniref:Uncharacterized protein n=1 Tax=Leucogyrophana mollusca TaxID=85980 RepID=A0ACB8BW29_9AGAM|nr:hypothetical protein BV22DRAFT_1116461 [Leucogyrophana mollusca]